MRTPEISRHYFDLKGKSAEKTVHELATKAFIADWCFLNPTLPDGKELCDLLVVFDDTVIVWQIKDLKIGSDGAYRRAETEKNIRQVMGAYRQLFELKTPVKMRSPSGRETFFSYDSIRKIFLISVILGDSEEVSSGIFEKKEKFIHILFREDVTVLLNELDTISDFVKYLDCKETFLRTGCKIVLKGGEKELLAQYITNNRSFDQFEGCTELFVESGSWKHLNSGREFKARKAADSVSYLWDKLVVCARDCGPEYESVARELGRPNRFRRRTLCQTFVDAQITANKQVDGTTFKRVSTLGEETYCFLFMDDPEPRELRKALLGTFCFVARGTFQQNHKVVGIATELRIRRTCSYDFCVLYMPQWTPANQTAMLKAQQEFGILRETHTYPVHFREYPES